MLKFLRQSLPLLIVLGCTQASQPKANYEIVTPKPELAQPRFTGIFSPFLLDEDTTAISLQMALLLHPDEPGLISNIREIKLTDGDELMRFYGKKNYQPVWIYSTMADSALSALAEIEDDGLTPEHYGSKEIAQSIEKMQIEKSLTATEWAELDVIITHALLKFGRHLLKGKVNPKKMATSWNFELRQSTQPLSELLSQTVDSNSLAPYFRNVRPQQPLYQATRKSLKHYRALAADTVKWHVLTFKQTKTKLEPGGYDGMMPQLRLRLMAEGFLPLETPEVDSLNTYAPWLAGGVAAFQAQHGLYSDSVLGKSTLERLNITLQEKINALIVNLERLRWVIGQQPSSFILVNNAAYQLIYFEGDTVNWRTEVIIGAPYTATPFFTERLQRVIFNPTWTVPYSIASKEVLPKLKRNPGYLAANNMVLLNRSGQKVSPSTVNFHMLTERNFPYTIRQEPGPGNALGFVKFELPNPHSIYLHDTPTRNLFARDERALSHGCIRVNKPLTLAEKVLKGNTGWNEDTIPKILKSKKTTSIRVQREIPVMILYLTAFANVREKTFFFKDIYCQDEALLKALYSD